MDAVYPAAASALSRGRRTRRADPRLRHRTQPVTFAEIKEVDEENEEAAAAACVAEERRRRPDLLDERLGRQFAESRRRRARRDVLRERDPDESAGQQATVTRAGSEPSALNRHATTDHCDQHAHIHHA